jgi:hypothetical protein
LLRAVILGGHGKLAMRDIVQLCEKAGFAGARPYIARGERGVFLRFRRKDGEGDFGSRMQAFTGALVPVMIRRSARSRRRGGPVRSTRLSEIRRR